MTGRLLQVASTLFVLFVLFVLQVPSGRRHRVLRRREHIAEVLKTEHGNKRAAAARLGLSRRTLYRRLHLHELPLGRGDGQ